MIPAEAALSAGAAALLEARGERDLAATVAGADVEVVGQPEAWLMGSRTVTAHRVALVVDAGVYAALARDPAKLEAVKAAFAAAMRTPETELADLMPVLRLPVARRGWHRAYRDAPAEALSAGERAEASSVLGGAAALLGAMGDPKAAAMALRGSLESADVPGASFPPLRRYVLRLDAADYAGAQRDAELGERLKRAVSAAGTRADEAVATVELATGLSGPLRGAAGAAEARLIRALQELGATVVPVARGADAWEVTLAVIAAGEVRVVEVIAGDPGDRRVKPRKGARVPWVLVPGDAITDDAAAQDAAAEVCEGMDL